MEKVFRIVQHFLYCFGILIFICFLHISIEEKNPRWFTRSGSIITTIPIIISLIDFYTNRELNYLKDKGYAISAPPNVEKEARIYFPVKLLINSLLLIIGTIISGFGDLIFNYFTNSK